MSAILYTVGLTLVIVPIALLALSMVVYVVVDLISDLLNREYLNAAFTAMVLSVGLGFVLLLIASIPQ